MKTPTHSFLKWNTTGRPPQQPAANGLTPAGFSERGVYAAAVAVFLAAAALTLYWQQTMSGGMRMLGGWTMSHMWMLMPGQTWLTAAVMFVAMWQAMMIAMMLPSALPMLLLYRRVTAYRGEASVNGFTALVAAGYFAVWLGFGLIAYASGMAVSQWAMKSETVSRAVPFATAAALIAAGGYQLTPWKLACLRHCRNPLRILEHHVPGGWRGALGLGLHHGAFCAACCWALMLIQLALGVMNLPVMVAIAAVIAIEKLLRHGELVAWLAGAMAAVAGLAILAAELF